MKAYALDLRERVLRARGLGRRAQEVARRYPIICVWVGFIVTVSPSPQAGR